MKNFILICSTIIFLSMSAFAQWSNDAAENNPLSTASGEQALPKVATSENGTTYIAWFSNESGNYNVMLQKLDVFGNMQWDSAGLLVSDHEAMSSLTEWDMIIDQEDHAIITFQDVRTGSNNIYAYRISPEAEFVWGDDGLALSNSSTFDASPTVTVTNEGNAVVAWAPDLEIVILQKISPEGDLLWGDNGITLSGNNMYSWPQLLPVGDDDIILKYFEDIGQFPAITRHIFAQRYDTDGNTVWDQPAIITDAGSITAWTQIIPFINDGEDGFYIAWHDYRANPTIASIYVQHIGSDGTVLFANNGVEASLWSNRNHFYAQLALPPGSEDIFIYWNEMDGDQNLRGIYGQKISSTGERLWTNNGKSFIEISSTNVYPVAARNSGTDMIVIYEEYSNVLNAGIKAMRIDTDGNYVWENEKIDMCSVQSEKVHSVTNSFFNNQWITSWEDSRNGGKDIYAQNIQLDGILGPITIPADLTVWPDSIIFDVFEFQSVHIINNTLNEVIVDTVYIEIEWYVEIVNTPPPPYILGVGDSVLIELAPIPGSDSYSPLDYEYDILHIESEVGNYYVDIAINWDLLGAVKENNQTSKVVKVMPNPAKDYISFTSVSDDILNSEIIIFNAFGTMITSFEPKSHKTFIWDLTDNSGIKVPSGTYFYNLISDKYHETGKIIIIE